MANTNKVDLAKARIALHCGYMLPLVTKLKWVDTTSVPVAATNGKQAFYNGEHFENERTLGEAIFIVLHEVGHCMLAHMSRVGTRNRQLANIAMDYALNKRLKDMIAQQPSLKAEVPKDALLDEAKWGDMNWEAIYDQLRKDNPSIREPGQKGSGMGMFDEVLPSGTKPDGEGDDEGDEEGQGSGGGMTQDEVATLDKSWLLAAQAAATMAKARGIKAGLLEEFINEIIKPNIDWQTQLVDLISRVSRDESSWRRFNRRHLHRESYMPGMYSERIGPIAFMLDVSGSISSRECSAALGAMNDILEDCKPELIYFGQCDTRMQGEVQELTPQDLPLTAMKVSGRGGTDLNPLFEWAVQHEQDIDALIVQTDGYISTIEPNNIPHGIPVIWIATTDATQYMTFGNVVKVVV